jgi:hypothetical protein
MLLVGLVLALGMSVLVNPAHPDAGGPALTSTIAATPASVTPASVTPASAKVQPAPVDRGSANLRHTPGGPPLAETARSVGSTSLASDAAEGPDRPLSLSRSWAARSPGAVRRVLDTVAPRLGRAPPPSA